MNVVIVGAWNRSEAEDTEVVNKLLDMLAQAYPKLYVITTGCDRSIGKIVKARCMPRTRQLRGEFDFVEIAIRIYCDQPPKAKLAEIWTARNGMLAELGEEFHLFMSQDQNPSAWLPDLYNRVKALGRPYAVYMPGEKKPKWPEIYTVPVASKAVAAKAE